MASVNDWAAKAARRIMDEDAYQPPPGARRRGIDQERIAAIIATFAEPLMALLRESKREHEHGLHGARCCPQCTCECWPDDPEADFEPTPNSDEPCTCGAAKWNARVDKALEG